MNVYGQFLAILKRNGKVMTLRHCEEEHPVSAYIAPFTYANRQYLEDRCSILGTQDQNSFLYIGSPEDGGALMAVGDFLYDDTQCFVVSVCEVRRLADQPFCIWGILRRASGEVLHG